MKFDSDKNGNGFQPCSSSQLNMIKGIGSGIMGSFDHMALGSDDEGHIAFKGQDRQELQLNQKPSLCKTELK